MPTPAHLEPSQLGTKEYWDSLYTTELANHAADSSDIGTCWFDDSDAQTRILRFLRTLTSDPFPSSDSESSSSSASDSKPERDGQNAHLKPQLSRHSTSFLDLGCGNGALLFALRSHGWSGPMLGIDYSPQSISLATQIQSSALTTPPLPSISFKQWDLLHGDAGLISGPQPWDVVLDKGTFDAISLAAAEHEDEDGKGKGTRPVEAYRARVLPLLKEGGVFVITSCNWTEEELRAWFEGDSLRVVGRVEYPTFTFGGAKGQTITTLCFQRGGISSS